MLTTDVHCHLLPGVDHGSRSRADTMIMAGTLADLGVRRVYATPHQYRFGIDLTRADISTRCEEVQGWLDAAGIELDVSPGAENYYSERLWDALDADEELVTWSAADEDEAAELLLVELPTGDAVVGVGNLAHRLASRGIRPVMAHPERIEMIQRNPERVRRWIDGGWRMQLDLLSLVRAYGRNAEQLARWLLEEGHYAFVGSDLHRTSQVASLRAAHAAYRSLVPGGGDA